MPVHVPRWTIVGPALALALVAAGCGAARAGATTPADNRVEVRAAEFTFTPQTIRVPVDRPVRLVMTNAGLLEHDLVVEKLPAKGVRQSAGGHGHGSDVAVHTAPGRQGWVEFTPTARGTYDVICTISGHKEAGMRAQLIVE
jgi:uncharacterized cupredoxin-like copper-binding protein